jgi:hypothetical protein
LEQVCRLDQVQRLVLVLVLVQAPVKALVLVQAPVKALVLVLELSLMRVLLTIQTFLPSFFLPL